MRFGEMTNADLIKQVEDDALARELYRRLVLADVKVTEREQSLEHQRDKALEDCEKAMHQVSQLENEVKALERSRRDLDDLVKRILLASPSEGIAIHDKTLHADMTGLEVRFSTEWCMAVEGKFLRLRLMEPSA